jgi:hypothetical protein|tara:strand:- start:126 stop:332 length:207 start_codon:yes stop_codon:yes gene_type:complete
MMDVQAEADRLLSLDGSGRERELVVIGLRLGQQAESSWRELRGMDEEFLRVTLTDNKRGDEVTLEGEE